MTAKARGNLRPPAADPDYEYSAHDPWTREIGSTLRCRTALECVSDAPSRADETSRICGMWIEPGASEGPSGN
jgi:hypothetical protein